jgi:hypothetical protein
MTTDPRLEKPPTMMQKQEVKIKIDRVKRLQMLKENLRLNHITEGVEEIEKNCVRNM